jgi:NitT/TauT family transport system permease protein
MISAFRPNRSVTKKVWATVMAAWALFILAAWVQSAVFLVPGPPQVLSALGRAIAHDGLIYEVWVSARVNAIALFLSTLISMIVSYLTVVAATRPAAWMVSKLRFVSLAGLYPIFMMTFGGGDALKVSLLTFGETVFMVTSMAAIVDSIPKSNFDQARTLRFSEWRVVWEVVVLGTADQAFEVVKQNAGMGLAMLTMVEGLVRSGGGVGVMMIDYGRHYKYDMVYAGLFSACLLGASCDAILSWAQGAVCPHSLLAKERG